MRVAIIASWYPTLEEPFVGSFVRHQAQELARLCDVAVLVPRFVPWRRVLTGRWGAPRVIEPDGAVTVFRQRYCHAFPRYPFALSLAHSAHAVEVAFRTLLSRWGRPDLLHAHVALPAGYAAVKIGEKYGLPVLLTEHTGPLNELTLRTRRERNAFRDTLHRCDRVIGVSPEMERQIHEFDPTVPVTIVPNLIRARFFVPPPEEPRSEQQVRFFLLGLLVERKGGRYLVEAANLLVRRNCTRFRVVIGGDGPSRASWEKMVADQGLQAYFQFPGRLTDEEVRHQMQHCDVFVLPSLHENFGIVSGEAMACGKPVLATRCGGSEYVITPETGVLVPPSDAAALAEAMEGFIAGRLQFDPVRARQSVVERFGEEAFLANLERVYDGVLHADHCFRATGGSPRPTEGASC